MATIVQSLLLVNVGMELAMSTIVIGALYKKPHAEFALTESESSWYGKKHDATRQSAVRKRKYGSERTNAYAITSPRHVYFSKRNNFRRAEEAEGKSPMAEAFVRSFSHY